MYACHVSQPLVRMPGHELKLKLFASADNCEAISSEKTRKQISEEAVKRDEAEAERTASRERA